MIFFLSNRWLGRSFVKELVPCSVTLSMMMPAFREELCWIYCKQFARKESSSSSSEHLVKAPSDSTAMFALSGVWKSLYLMVSPCKKGRGVWMVCWTDMACIFEFLLHFDYYSDSVTKPDYYYFYYYYWESWRFQKRWWWWWWWW